MSTRPIPATFNYDSHYLEVLGSKIHYIDEGEGDPILFLHGNPTCNYLWRNIIPYLSDKGRCIAPDLIGMGKSDKPDIRYGFEDSYRYLSRFIEQMELKNVTLVVHDWGSGLGFHYATQNKSNIKAIAFMESMHVMPSLRDLPGSVRFATAILRSPVGKFAVRNFNLFIDKVLPEMIIRNLTDKEKAVYSAPYLKKDHRRPLWVWPKDVPMDPKKKTPVRIAYEAWNAWLPTSDIPKLLIYVTPGSAVTKKDAEKVGGTYINTDVVNVGEGLHFFQEDCPHETGEALAEWYAKIG